MLSRGNHDALQRPSSSTREDEVKKTPERAGDVQHEHIKNLVEKIKGPGREEKAHDEAHKTVEDLRLTLDTARANLARKKGELKDFEMLFVGTLKGLVHGEKKANIQKEYDEFLKKYQEARAAYVVADVSKLTEERMILAEALVEAKGKGEEHFLYKGYTWLGNQNVGRLFSEKFGWNLSDGFQKDHPLASGALRVAGKVLSVRTAISLGLLGAGLMAGVGSGLTLGLGILGARAAMRGIGTAAGSHDMLKAIGAEAWESKGTLKYKKEEPWYKKISLWEKLTPEEMGKMKKDQVEERLAHMEANALLHGKKVGESEVYKQLLSEYEHKLKAEMHQKGEDVVSFMKDLSDASDTKRDNLAREKRIKHQTLVGVLTAAMVILPGIHQFQRVIDKNVGEWAAVTKKTGEFITGEPAEAKVPEARVFGSERMLHMTMGAPGDTIEDTHTTQEMIRGLKDKAVQLALAADVQAQVRHQLSIEDLRHIRNIASRATEEGTQMKSLLGYIEKKSLLRASDIQAVPLEGDHTTVYRALQDAAQKYPDYFKGSSVENRALEIAKMHGVTVDQLKTFPHTGETLYFSREGVIITQEKALIGHIGDVSHTHEPATGVRTHVGDTGGTEHVARTMHREVHQPRGGEESHTARKIVYEEKRGGAQPILERSHGAARVLDIGEQKPSSLPVPEKVGEKDKIIMEIVEAPAEKPPVPPVTEVAPQPKLEMKVEPAGGAPEAAAVSEGARETLKDGKFPLNVENFYGGAVFGSVTFNYDGQGNPISYKMNGQMFGVGSSHDLENKFLFSGWGYDKQTHISQELLAQGRRVDTSLLRDQLEMYNKELAFDIRLYTELIATDHRPEAMLVLKGAKQILARVHEYGLDDQLINTENLPGVLR